jgi:hypothetical protein
MLKGVGPSQPPGVPDGVAGASPATRNRLRRGCGRNERKDFEVGHLPARSLSSRVSCFGWRLQCSPTGQRHDQSAVSFHPARGLQFFCAPCTPLRAWRRRFTSWRGRPEPSEVATGLRNTAGDSTCYPLKRIARTAKFVRGHEGGAFSRVGDTLGGCCLSPCAHLRF